MIKPHELEDNFHHHGEEHAGKRAWPEWAPAACITSATVMQSQVAAVSIQEELRAEGAAAVVGEEAGLSLSVGLGMTCFHPHDSAHRNPVPAHPIFSSLCVANWATCLYLLTL